jgi:hypothetical protein
MVGRFLLQCLLLSLPVLGMLLGYCALNARYFPAPRITNNLSINEKALFLRERPASQVNILALGSSMTQINLSTKAVLERFGDTAYFNFSGWGMDMKQANELARLFVPRMKPRLYLMSSNLMDFSIDPDRADIDPPKVADLAFGGSLLKAYLTRPALAYYLRQMETNKTRFNDPSSYECLMFDAHGGVALNVAKERMNQVLMDRPPPAPEKLDSAQYVAFEDLCEYLRQEEVDLVYMLSPYRAGLHTAEADRAIALHAERVRTILARHGHRYADVEDMRWADSLYCDASHFNEAGAYAFSKEVLSRVK